MNGIAVTVEIPYSQEDDFELIESVRSWSTNTSLLATYPDDRSRLDEHLMDFLANGRHAESVAETITTVTSTGHKFEIVVDGAPVDADL